MSHYSMRRRNRKRIAEINVVPFIDVMLVLLIIFMVTAPIITTGVDVELPSADANPMEGESEKPVIVSINAQGQYFVDIGSNKQTPMSALDVSTTIRTHLQQFPQAQILLKGDKRVPHGDIVHLMVLLQQAGVPSIGFVTEPEGE